MQGIYMLYLNRASVVPQSLKQTLNELKFLRAAVKVRPRFLPIILVT